MSIILQLEPQDESHFIGFWVGHSVGLDWSHCCLTLISNGTELKSDYHRVLK